MPIPTAGEALHTHAHVRKQMKSEQMHAQEARKETNTVKTDWD